MTTTMSYPANQPYGAARRFLENRPQLPPLPTLPSHNFDQAERIPSTPRLWSFSRETPLKRKRSADHSIREGSRHQKQEQPSYNEFPPVSSGSPGVPVASLNREQSELAARAYVFTSAIIPPQRADSQEPIPYFPPITGSAPSPLEPQTEVMSSSLSEHGHSSKGYSSQNPSRQEKMTKQISPTTLPPIAMLDRSPLNPLIRASATQDTPPTTTEHRVGTINTQSKTYPDATESKQMTRSVHQVHQETDVSPSNYHFPSSTANLERQIIRKHSSEDHPVSKLSSLDDRQTQESSRRWPYSGPTSQATDNGPRPPIIYYNSHESPTRPPALNAYNPTQGETRDMPGPISQLNSCRNYVRNTFVEDEHAPRKRRGNLPKESTAVLNGWFLRHLDRPYPTEVEKQRFQADTGLSMLQITNWFINARRRRLRRRSGDIPKSGSRDD